MQSNPKWETAMQTPMADSNSCTVRLANFGSTNNVKQTQHQTSNSISDSGEINKPNYGLNAIRA